MEVTQFRCTHYDALKTIWEQYGWTAPSIEVLPRQGFVVFFMGKIVGASFVYLSCNGMAFLDWVVVDMFASPIVRGKAVYKSVIACRDFATKEGKAVLYTVTANMGLLKSYKKMGFQVMEKNATTMAVSLDGTKTDFLR